MTAKTLGRCTNVDYCELAASRKQIYVDLGEQFVCPNCNKPLHAISVDEHRPAGRIRPAVMAAAATGLIVAAVLDGRALLLGTAAPLQSSVVTSAGPNGGNAVTPATGRVLFRLSGDHSMGDVMMPRLVEGFLTHTGYRNVSSMHDDSTGNVVISGEQDGRRDSVTLSLGGADKAIEDLRNGRADICMCARSILPEEVEALKSVADMTSPEHDFVLALSGISIIVNPANSVTALTKSQVADIFSGRVTDWGQVGGAPGPIHVYTREGHGGMTDQFRAMVLNRGNFTPAATVIKYDLAEISARVAADAAGISLVPMSFIQQSKALAIGDSGVAALPPTRQTVQTEDYLLAYRIHLYVNNAGSSPMAPLFADYALSPAGQALVGKSGYVPMTIQVAQAPRLLKAQPAIALQTAAAAPVAAVAAAARPPADRYQQLVTSAQRLSVDFRFKPGSNNLDSRGLKDLDRLADLMTQNHWDESRLVLAGFSDNTGAPDANLAISKERADAVAAIFANRGMVPGDVMAFGAQAPVADNTTQEGRDRNRRVEVYLRPAG